MMFHIGSDGSLPLIEFEKASPSFHTSELTDDHSIVLRHFSTKNVLYVGSDMGCGCSFKHALLDKQYGWLNVKDEDQELIQSALSNSLELISYIDQLLLKIDKVELFVCWDGDYEEKPEWFETLSLNDISDKDFYFKERGFYTITK